MLSNVQLLEQNRGATGHSIDLTFDIIVHDISSLSNVRSLKNWFD